MKYKRTIKQRLVIDMLNKETKSQNTMFLKELFLILKVELKERLRVYKAKDSDWPAVVLLKSVILSIFKHTL